MRFRQVRVRYTALLPLPRLLGDPWSLAGMPTVARPEWRPPSDLFETDEEWVVKVEMAGLAEEDFEILLYEDRLIIKGYRPWSPARAEGRFHIAEIRHGAFEVEVPVLGSIEREKISAQYERGMLRVTLPKLRAER
jgi:HSP20 family molecular chaperone IbpA